jgi:hypothetical protein
MLDDVAAYVVLAPIVILAAVGAGLGLWLTRRARRGPAPIGVVREPGEKTLL